MSYARAGSSPAFGTIFLQGLILSRKKPSAALVAAAANATCQLCLCYSSPLYSVDRSMCLELEFAWLTLQFFLFRIDRGPPAMPGLGGLLLGRLGAEP